MPYTKLYHGTSESRARKLLIEGITPRGKRAGNWEHTIESNPKAVYLTDAYPIYFAYTAASNLDERGAVIEIDLAKVDQSRLHPDEDVLEQAGRKFDHLQKKGMIERTRYYRRHARENPNWQKSLEAMGTCGYYGVIPPQAISKIVLVEWKKFDAGFLLSMVDCSITLLNYRFCQDKYRAYTRWAMGEQITATDLGYMPQIFPGIDAQIEQIIRERSGFETLMQVEEDDDEDEVCPDCGFAKDECQCNELDDREDYYDEGETKEP